MVEPGDPSSGPPPPPPPAPAGPVLPSPLSPARPRSSRVAPPSPLLAAPPPPPRLVPAPRRVRPAPRAGSPPGLPVPLRVVRVRLRSPRRRPRPGRAGRPLPRRPRRRPSLCGPAACASVRPPARLPAGSRFAPSASPARPPVVPASPPRLRRPPSLSPAPAGALAPASPLRSPSPGARPSRSPPRPPLPPPPAVRRSPRRRSSRCRSVRAFCCPRPPLPASRPCPAPRRRPPRPAPLFSSLSRPSRLAPSSLPPRRPRLFSPSLPGRTGSGFGLGGFRRLSRAATEFASNLLELACLAAKRFDPPLKLFTNLLLAHICLSAEDEDTILVRSRDDNLGSASRPRPPAYVHSRVGRSSGRLSGSRIMSPQLPLFVGSPARAYGRSGPEAATTPHRDRGSTLALAPWPRSADSDVPWVSRDHSSGRRGSSVTERFTSASAERGPASPREHLLWEALVDPVLRRCLRIGCRPTSST